MNIKSVLKNMLPVALGVAVGMVIFEAFGSGIVNKIK